MKKIIIRNIIGLLIMAWLYYVMLPPLNLSAISFWFFICLLAVVFFIVNIGDSKWTVDKNQVKLIRIDWGSILAIFVPLIISAIIILYR